MEYERRLFMVLRVNFEQSTDVAVLLCSGRLVRGHDLDLLRECLTHLDHVRVIVLDLAEVEMIDAGALGVLVFLHHWTMSNGIQLKIVNPSRLVREMFERTRVNCVFDISSLEEALEILAPPNISPFRYAAAC